jgi:hypothetical protein
MMQPLTHGVIPIQIQNLCPKFLWLEMTCLSNIIYVLASKSIRLMKKKGEKELQKKHQLLKNQIKH